jgi:hypothetical protein
MATSLDPDFNPWQELQPYAQKMIAQSIRGGPVDSSVLNSTLLQSLMSGNGTQTLAELGRVLLERAVKLPQRLDNALTQIERGELKIQVEPAPAYRRQLQRIEAQGRRTTRAVMFAGFLIAATLFYTSGEIALGAAGFGLAAVTFLSLIVANGE